MSVLPTPPTAAPRESGQRFLANATFLLSLFCYLKLLPIQAEIQPFAAIPAFISIFFYRNPLAPLFLGYAGCMLGALGVSLAIAGGGGSYSSGESIQSFAALIAPAAVFVALLGNAHYLSVRIFTAVVALWTFVGFSQAFMPSLQSMLGLDTLFSSLISRYSPVLLRDWGRGATLLAPEPSYSARTIFLFIAAALYFWHRRLLSRRLLGLLLVASLFLAFVNQSATVAVMLIVYVVLLLPLRRLLLLGMSASLALLFVDLGSLRFVQVAQMGVDLVQARAIEDVVGFTNAFGSQRTISVAIAFGSVFTGRWLGGGFGSWSTDFLNEMERVGVSIEDVRFFTETLGYVVEVKPYSHFAMMAFELGVIGLILDTLLVWAGWKATEGRPVENRSIRRYIFATTTMSLLFLVTGSPVSAPEFWVSLALALNLRKHIPISVDNARISPRAVSA